MLTVQLPLITPVRLLLVTLLCLLLEIQIQAVQPVIYGTFIVALGLGAYCLGHSVRRLSVQTARILAIVVLSVAAFTTCGEYWVLSGLSSVHDDAGLLVYFLVIPIWCMFLLSMFLYLLKWMHARSR